MLRSLIAALRRIFQRHGPKSSAPEAPNTASLPPPALDADSSRPEAGPGAPAPVYPQPIPALVDIAGWFPTRGGGDASTFFPLGMVHLVAGHGPAYGAPRADGRLLPINQNQAPFSVIGGSFGGNMETNFALPNLDGRAPIGGATVGQFGQGSLTLTYMIATSASSVAPLPGMVALFAAGWAPDGWLAADGSVVPMYLHVPLFEAIGTTFGGQTPSTLALPDLDGTAVVGVGQGRGVAPVALGQQVAGAVPGLGLNYLISVTGPPPPISGKGAFPETGQYLGQVIAYAGAQVPTGWALCDGSLLQVSDNEPLFQLIGTTYGGDGSSTFALPDLRGRMVVGQSG